MAIEQILKRLTRARKQAGLSQSQVGKLIDLSTGGFCDIEKGRNPLSVERFLQLCEIYDVSATWALTGVNPYFTEEHASKVVEAAQRINMDAKELHDLLSLFESLRQNG